MSKEKTTPAEAARLWIAKHSAEGLNLKALEAALSAVDSKTLEAQAIAAKLGAVLEARKGAVKTLKEALKAARANRKSPQPAAPKAVTAPKKAPVKKAPPTKA